MFSHSLNLNNLNKLVLGTFTLKGEKVWSSNTPVSWKWQKRNCRLCVSCWNPLILFETRRLRGVDYCSLAGEYANENEAGVCGPFCCMAHSKKLWAASRLEKRETKDKRGHDTRTKEIFFALHLLVSNDVLDDIFIYKNPSLLTLFSWLNAPEYIS